MDTTTSTSAGGEDQVVAGYVSCIKVDGSPILPPVMTEERRREMRSYKELAKLKEKELREKRLARSAAVVSGTVSYLDSMKTLSPNLSPVQSPPMQQKKTMKQEQSSSSASPGSPKHGRGVPATSTPRSARVHTSVAVGPSSNLRPAIGGGGVAGALRGVRRSATFSYTPEPNPSEVPEGVLRERKVLVPIQDLNKSGSSDPSGGGSSSVMSYDGDEEKDDAGPESSDNKDSDGSDDNFASAASSAGTFIIRKSDESKVEGGPQASLSARREDRSASTMEGQVTTSEDEPENENAPPTVLLRPDATEELIFKRKRPATYFDDDDNATPKMTDFASIPHRVLQEEEEHPDSKLMGPPTGTHLSFSSVPHTNFSHLAKSLTKEFSQKFCANLVTPSATTSVAKSSNKGSSGGSYNVTLSKEIPSSAEENPKSDSDDVSNCSDKENRNTAAGVTKHVRKLSYTLATPSDALLQATSRDRNFAQRLETVPSETGSVGIQSANPTPTKSSPGTDNLVKVPFSLRSVEAVTKTKTSPVGSSLAKLNLGQGKQAHLERFLVDQEGQQHLKTTSPIESMLIKMQRDHEAKLHQLAEQHRLQELRIRQEFESELEKIKEKLSSTLNTTDSGKSLKSSPTSLLESISPSSEGSISARPLTGTSAALSGADEITLNSGTNNSQKMITSGMSGVSVSEQTKSGTNIYQFMGVTSNQNQGPVDLAAVGLSKLQSRMQMMSPRFFRTPSDAKSPLLKGLVFPDPLDKPKPPIRFPAKALEASMKCKFDRISAAVKGYLIRRLLNTEKVQIIVQTIRDTVDLLLKLYEESPMVGNVPSVKTQDSQLHQLLVQQTGACRSFHDVFFKLSTKERMAIIENDREKQRAKALRALSSPSKPNISNATLKSIERRQSHRVSPKKDSRKSRLSRVHEMGSHSVKPRPVKSFNVSPKRRRISYWDDGATLRSSAKFASQQDLNGNNFKTPMTSARSQASLSSSSARSARNQLPTNLGAGDTFIVSSANRAYFNSGNGKSNQPRRESSSRSSTARSGQSGASVVSSNSGRTTGASSRQPWK